VGAAAEKRKRGGPIPVLKNKNMFQNEKNKEKATREGGGWKYLKPNNSCERGKAHHNEKKDRARGGDRRQIFQPENRWDAMVFSKREKVMHAGKKIASKDGVG